MDLFGMDVVVRPDHPKRQLSADCPVTDKCRREINAWMIEFFGVTNMIPDGECWSVMGRIHMNPRTFAHIKAGTTKYTLNSFDWMRG